MIATGPTIFGYAAPVAPETPTLTQLSQVIAEVTAPAFMMGAIAGFASLMAMRLHRILDRSHMLT